MALLRTGLYLLHLLLTGAFFHLCGFAIQNFVWNHSSEFSAANIPLPVWTRAIIRLFCSSHNHPVFYHLSGLCWLAIAFVIFVSWRQRKSAQSMFLRVLVITWFVFLLHLVVVAAIGCGLYLPALRPISELNADHPVAVAITIIYLISFWSVFLFAVVLALERLIVRLNRTTRQ